MNDYLYADVVQCEPVGEHSVFEAPPFSGLKEGDRVLVDVGDAKAVTKVLAVGTIKYKAPLNRVVGAVTVARFDWRSLDEARRAAGIA